MKIKLERKKTLALLAQHQNNIDKKAINPIFSSIRFFSDGNKIMIRSMDGERVLEHTFIEPINEDFNMFLPGFNLYELLRKSTQEFFEIEEAEENYILKIGNGEFKFAKYAHKSYPNWIDDCENVLELNVAELNNALKTVKWASSSDDSRPFLNGVCFDIKKDKVSICATDGLRLALNTIKNNSEFEGVWILSKKSINDLIKLLEDGEGNLFLKLGNNAQVIFKTSTSDVVWKTLLVAGKFPQYEKIIPNSFIATMKIETKEFIEKLERVMITANLNQPIITLALDNNSIEVFSESALSSGKDILSGEYDGEKMNISFNARLLIEMLHNLSGKLKIGINNPYSPILIESEEIANSLFILAPVKRD